MSFRIAESSGDVVVEASAETIDQAFVELSRGFSAVVTGGARVEFRARRLVRISSPDIESLVVAFVNELVYAFDADGFLPSEGRLRVENGHSAVIVEGEVGGEAFEAARHGGGVEVKAATFHELKVAESSSGVTIRVLLDL